jgi:hypothetical protein
MQRQRDVVGAIWQYIRQYMSGLPGHAGRYYDKNTMTG